MNDEAGVEVARQDLGDDAIEGNGDGFDGRIEDFEREIGGREGTGNSNLDAAEILQGNPVAGDDHGTVPFADAAATAHQRVVLLDVGVSVEADGADIVEGLFACAAVEGLDIAKRVRKAIAGDANFIRRQAVEHEGIVGVGAMGDGDFQWHGWIRVLTGDFRLLAAHDGGNPFGYRNCDDCSLWQRRFGYGRAPAAIFTRRCPAG